MRQAERRSGEGCADLLDAEDEVRDVDELLQRPELVAVAAARGGLEAAAHDAAAHVDVRRGGVLVRQTQSFLESPDLVRFITPAGSQDTIPTLQTRLRCTMQSCSPTLYMRGNSLHLQQWRKAYLHQVVASNCPSVHHDAQ